MIKQTTIVKDGEKYCVVLAGKVLVEGREHIDKPGTSFSRTYTTTIKKTLSIYDIANLESIHGHLQHSFMVSEHAYIPSPERIAELLVLLSNGKVGIWVPFPEKRVGTLLELPTLYDGPGIR